MKRKNARQAIGILFLMGCILAMTGCGKEDSVTNYFKDPSAEPIKAVVRTTVPLAYAASVAMATACTTSSYPCTATVTITDDDSTLPLRFATFGTIMVYGYWTSADDALLTVLFVNTYAGSSLFRVNHVSAFPVKRTLSGALRIVYANLDVDIVSGPKYPEDLSESERNLKLGLIDITSSTTSSTDPSVNIDVEAWIIDVDTAGTTYHISGGGQYIDSSAGSVSILQLGMADVVMGPCESNPTSGLAALNEVSSSDSQTVVATAALSFGTNACDGRAKVVAGMGNYLLSTGTYIPLNLSNP